MWRWPPSVYKSSHRSYSSGLGLKHCICCCHDTSSHYYNPPGFCEGEGEREKEGARKRGGFSFFPYFPSLSNSFLLLSFWLKICLFILERVGGHREERES